MKSLSSKEKMTLYRILRLLNEGLLGYPQEEWELDYYDESFISRKEIKSLIRKLSESISKKELIKVDKEIMMRKYGGFSRGPDERVYAILEEAFDEEVAVDVEYFSPSREEVTKRKIDIYYLSRKYIVAYCYKREDIRKFRTDRFISAKLTDEEYTIPKNFNKKEYV